MFHNGKRPIHPGEIFLGDYLGPLNMPPLELAERLGVTPALINQILNKERGITPEIALLLAHCFGGDAQSWTNLQAIYDHKAKNIAAGRDS